MAWAVRPFNLADIGEGIVEVEVLQWFIKEGDKIAEFDKICEVQSDKASVEISSRFTGRVTKLHYRTGQVAKVGQPLIDIDLDNDTAADAASPAAAAAAAPAAAAPAAAATHAAPINHLDADGATFATPAVRSIAKQHNVDLHRVQGTGKGGRVMKEDVLRHIGQLPPHPSQPAAAAAPAPAPLHVAIAAPAPSTVTPATLSTPTAARGDRREPVRGFKKVMIKTMNESWRRIPHFGFKDEVTMEKASKAREQLKEVAAKQGVKFSYMPILIKAASMALLEFPILNSSLTDDETEIIYKASHNIGVAMDTPQGLVVPNIKDVQHKSMLEIASELNRLQQLGSKSQFSPADLSGGTFTLSNIGTIGGTYMNPVIVSPEVCIGAVGAIRRQVIPNEEDNWEKLLTMPVSWSADHRIIDGATMARFHMLWKSYVEHPERMLAHSK